MSEYARRDIIELDRRGGHYARHIASMTDEGLHSKADIAAELAWRDSEIESLEILVANLLACSAPKIRPPVSAVPQVGGSTTLVHMGGRPEVPSPVGVPPGKWKFKL